MKPMSAINVIPFIDIMLVLLAVVLTTATFVAQGRIPVTLPEASSAEPPEQRETVEITIAADGALFVDTVAVGAEDLAGRLAVLDKETRLLLRVDETAAFSHFVSVIDLLKAEQLRNVSIVTRDAGRGP